MNDLNWRIEVDSADYFGQQKKQVQFGTRRPVIRKPSDLVGPGIAAQAVRLTDFNDILATYDGFFSAEDTALNAPVVGSGGFVGTVTGDAELGGVQIFTALDTEATYLRVFRRNPSDAATIYWGTWEIINAGTAGGGGTGVVGSIQEGLQITVDDTDPVNPIVGTIGLVETIQPGEGIAVDDADPYNPVISTLFDPNSINDSFINTDRFAATGPGTQEFDLSYVPAAGSLHVRWEPLNIPIIRCTLVDNHLTITDPDNRFRADDPITAAYAVNRDAPLLVVPPVDPTPLVDWEDSGWKWLQIARLDATDYSSPTFDDSGWASGTGAFGDTTPDHDAIWPGGWPDYTTVWAQNTRMWARRTVTLDPTKDALMSVRLNKSVKVYVNGTLVWYWSAASGDSTHTLPMSLITGTDVFAIQVTDDSFSGPHTGCYFDFKIEQ